MELKPDLADAWRALGDHLHAVDDAEGADQAYASYLKASSKDPRLMAAAAALCDNRLAVAEALLREHLKQFPTDVAAIRMLAEVAARLGRYGDAENLLDALPRARAQLRGGAAQLCDRCCTGRTGRRRRWREIERLLAEAPQQSGYRNLKAATLARIGEYEEAIALYEQLLAAVSRASEGLDELRPCAEDGRAAGRRHRRLSRVHPPRAELRRGLVEPRQPEDVSLRRRRYRGDAKRSCSART